MKQVLLELLIITFFISSISCTAKQVEINGCCWFPCQNGGFCLPKSLPPRYKCDCDGTGFYGRNCTRPYLSTKLKNLFRLKPETSTFIVSNFYWIWYIVNKIYFLRAFLMKQILIIRTGIVDIPPVYSVFNPYPKAENGFNQSFYAQTLPPVPIDCPTPMGVFGPKQLPDVKVVADQMFKRIKFIPNKLRSNVLFATFAQHFTHMFFKSDIQKGSGMQFGDHNIFMSNIYGDNKTTEHQLRSFENGKLKSQFINGGEEFPLYMTDLPEVPNSNPLNISPKKHFAMGHPFYNLLTHLAYWQTIFLREHNRVADMLAEVHPEWDDERLFQTSRLILIGQTLKIVVEDYVQHLSNYNFKLLFDPTIMHSESMQYQNRIHFEFNLLYHWHPLMPDSVNVKNITYNMQQWMINGVEPLVRHGSTEFTRAIINSWAGHIGPQNHGKMTLHVAEKILQQARDLRIMPFNQYRRRFRLSPVKSFTELTKDRLLAERLTNLYGDIDALELYVGLIAEKGNPIAMFGTTMIEMGAPYSLQVGLIKWRETSTQTNTNH